MAGHCSTCNNDIEKRSGGYKRKLIDSFISNSKDTYADIIKNYGIEPKSPFICFKCAGLLSKITTAEREFLRRSNNSTVVHIKKKCISRKPGLRHSLSHGSTRRSFISNASKYLRKGRYLTCFNILIRNSTRARNGFRKAVKRMVYEEMRNVKNNPVLSQRVSIESLRNFNWHKAIRTIEKTMPIFTLAVRSVLTPWRSGKKLSMNQGKYGSMVPGYGFLLAVAVHLRYPRQLKFLSSITAIEMYRSGCRTKNFIPSQFDFGSCHYRMVISVRDIVTKYFKVFNACEKKTIKHKFMKESNMKSEIDSMNLLYNTSSVSQEGSLLQIRNRFHFSKVGKKVMDNVNHVVEFWSFVTEAYVCLLVCKMLSISHLEEIPAGINSANVEIKLCKLCTEVVDFVWPAVHYESLRDASYIDVNGLLPERLAQELIWNSTANLAGLPGQNLALDLVNEFLNNDFKNQLKDSRGKYSDKHVERCSRLVGHIGDELESVFIKQVAHGHDSRFHKKDVDQTQNISKFLNMYRGDELLDFHSPGRAHEGFHGFVHKIEIKNPEKCARKLLKCSQVLDMEHTLLNNQ
ncbi:hypothetical protein FSP39_011323 [Pinctada imbricata]|uniref:ZAD domain-containing protein n=1 Tax=Pinctada imbricata TaxID=66713 RepID=A0AA88YV91_PINIB|nr:hypothetical protein FSP39_011323 [Pinctada imbricata]